MATTYLDRNVFERLRQIERLGHEAVAAGHTKRAARLRELWKQTKAEINANELCQRCYGQAIALAIFSHVNSRECLRCNGRGIVPKGGNAKNLGVRAS